MAAFAEESIAEQGPPIWDSPDDRPVQAPASAPIAEQARALMPDRPAASGKQDPAAMTEVFGHYAEDAPVAASPPWGVRPFVDDNGAGVCLEGKAGEDWSLGFCPRVNPDLPPLYDRNNPNDKDMPKDDRAGHGNYQPDPLGPPTLSPPTRQGSSKGPPQSPSGPTFRPPLVPGQPLPWLPPMPWWLPSDPPPARPGPGDYPDPPQDYRDA